MRPLIAVTGPHKRLRFAWWATRIMLALQGLRGIYLTAQQPFTENPVQGVIIGGGDDIEPLHYGQQGDAGATYDPQRDAFEMAVIRHCLESRVPMLGICRGAQLINVVLGGSLYNDIRPLRRATPNYNSALPVKWVDVQADCTLAGYLQTQRVKVNSLHSQAIERLGCGLRKVAVDQDGFTQAVEAADSFLVGVQWHPEYLPYKRAQRRLFSGFARAAREASQLHISDDLFT
nr:putative type 1 glutamine amidotransferase [uncultured bacterium]